MLRLIPLMTLVIDDEESVGRRIRELLGGPGSEVVIFTSAIEAIEFARKTSPRIALVDLRLPDADSPVVIETLRAASPRTRIIAMTAFPDAALVIAAMRAGARDLVEKPIQPESLKSAIDRQLVECGVVARSEDEFNQRLGGILRDRRQSLGRSLVEIAESSGLSMQQVSQIELGRTATSTWTLARVAAALDSSIAELMSKL